MEDKKDMRAQSIKGELQCHQNPPTNVRMVEKKEYTSEKMFYLFKGAHPFSSRFPSCLWESFSCSSSALQHFLHNIHQLESGRV